MILSCFRYLDVFVLEGWLEVSMWLAFVISSVF